MSRRRKPPTSRRHVTVDLDVGVLIGWCEHEADLEAVKQSTHDSLINMMGDARRGPVTWRISTDRALDVITRFVDNASQLADTEAVKVYSEARALIAAHGGFLVVATAPGARARAGHQR